MRKRDQPCNICGPQSKYITDNLLSNISDQLLRPRSSSAGRRGARLRRRRGEGSGTGSTRPPGPPRGSLEASLPPTWGPARGGGPPGHGEQVRTPPRREARNRGKRLYLSRFSGVKQTHHATATLPFRQVPRNQNPLRERPLWATVCGSSGQVTQSVCRCVHGPPTTWSSEPLGRGSLGGPTARRTGPEGPAG